MPNPFPIGTGYANNPAIGAPKPTPGFPANDPRKFPGQKGTFTVPKTNIPKWIATLAARRAIPRLNPWLQAGMTVYDIYQYLNNVAADPGGAIDGHGVWNHYCSAATQGGPPARWVGGSNGSPVCGTGTADVFTGGNAMGTGVPPAGANICVIYYISPFNPAFMRQHSIWNRYLPFVNPAPAPSLTPATPFAPGISITDPHPWPKPGDVPNIAPNIVPEVVPPNAPGVFPAPTPGQSPKPYGFPGVEPSYQPKTSPWPRPGVSPFPSPYSPSPGVVITPVPAKGEGPTIVIEAPPSPGSGPKPGQLPVPSGPKQPPWGPPHKSEPPKKKEKDNKFKGGKAGQIAGAIYGAATEGVDMIDAAWNALPANGGWQTKVKGQATTPAQKLADIANALGSNNGYKFDKAGFMQDFAINAAKAQAQDYAIGKASNTKGINKALGNAGYTGAGVGFGPAL